MNARQMILNVLIVHLTANASEKKIDMHNLTHFRVLANSPQPLEQDYPEEIHNFM